MVKKIIKSKEIEKATKIFTDREKPRQVFWNEYNKLKENIGNIDDIYIITYYGVGGIGKSTLIKKLITELEEQEQDPYYLKFDFETNNDMKTILSMMKTNMEQKYKFTFPLFDMALYAYSYKIGENTEKPEIKTFAEQSRVLSFIFDSLEDIPLVGLGAKILKLADSGIAILKNSNQKYKNELIEIENKTPDEIYKDLPYYFSQDLNLNLEKINKPFVIFLDTYEKLVNEIKGEGYTIMQDLWLRDEKGPILQVPGVLWVLAGREKIKWGEYDHDWEETLKQHILGDLSFKDANEFLIKAEVTDEKIRSEIYHLTNGTPIFLDICVDTYQLLKEKNETITIDKFGKNVEILVERFLRYMDNQSSELVYALSNINTWNDDLITEIMPKILPNFSITLYEKIKKLSFICEENNTYYIHKTINHIYNLKCPKIIKEKTLKELYKYYLTFIQNNSKLNKNYINYVHNFINIIPNIISKENTTSILEDVDEVLDRLDRGNLHNEYIYNSINAYNLILPICQNNPDSFILKMHYAIALSKQNINIKSLDILTEVLEYLITTDFYDYTAQCIMELSKIYLKYRHIEKIQNIIDKIENINLNNYENIRLYTLANLYKTIDNYEKAKKYYQKAFELETNENNKVTILYELLMLDNKNQEYINTLENYLKKESNITYYNQVISYGRLRPQPNQLKITKKANLT